MSEARSERTVPGIEAEEDEEKRSGSRTERALKILSPLLVIGAGVGVVLLLRATAPQPERAEPGPPGARVEVVTATRFEGRPQIRVQGTVTPARQTRIGPEVQGRVEWVSPQLVPGGRFEEGDPMLRIDPTDYRLALNAARGEVAQAELAVRQQRAGRDADRRAWEILEEEGAIPPEVYTEEGRELALNEPQLAAALEQLESARSREEQARVNLERTTLRAPFPARVEEETVDVGQQVSRMEPVATLTGTERYFVRASVPVQKVPFVRTGAPDAPGAPARIVQTLQGREYVWEGYVESLLPAVDERGSMARVVIVVPDPLGLEGEGRVRDVPLLIDSFVDVRVEAEPLPTEAVEVPRAALRDGDQVWIASDDGRLEMRDVEVAWRREETVLLSAGVEPGERVIVSQVAVPVEGMRVRTSRPDGGAEPAPRELEASLP